MIRRWELKDSSQNNIIKEASAIESKYAKYSTEQLEVILTHLADPDEKEAVKTELSRRYYNHYLDIINTPEPQPQSSAVPAPNDTPLPVDAADSDKDKPAPDQRIGMNNENGQAKTSLGLADDLAGIAEVSPIRLTAPGPQQTSPAGTGKPASDKGAKKGWCFIATAAYGSPLAREVVLLQGFRDNCLSRHALGEKFIRGYYRFSPPLAAYISRHKVLKRMTRLLLFPVILAIKQIFRSPGPS